MSGEPVYSEDGGIAAGSKEPDEGSASYWEIKLAAKDREIAALRKAAISVGASLAAAISLLERGGKKAAPSDKMFKQMLVDYRGSLERARAALKGNGEG
jgi:hypothetical protein